MKQEENKGMSLHDMERKGMTWQGKARQAIQGKEMKGMVRQGKTRK
jgi:hypothetical protein